MGRAWSHRGGIAWAVLLGLWVVLYLPHLRTSPGWYGDETIALQLGKNLVHGELAFGAVYNTFLTAVYQPLYLAVVGLGYAVVGDIVGARFVNALLALATAIVLWRLGRRVFPTGVAFAAAVCFLCYEQSILHFRQTFPHNGVCFGAALGVLATCLPVADKKGRWMAGAGVAIALGSHPLGIYVAAACGLARIFRPRTWLALALPSVVMGLVFYGLVVARFGGWLWEDLRVLAGSYASYSQENSGRLLENLVRFYSQDSFHMMGLVGCFAMVALVGRRRRFPVTLFVTTLSLALFSNRSNLTVFYYQAVPLVPMLALGFAFALDFTIGFATRFFGGRALRCRLRKVLPVVAVALLLPTLGGIASGTLRPRNFIWVTQSPAEVEAAAQWLNENADANDLVIANSNIAWLLNARTADLFQWTSWDGKKTFMYVKPISRERFRYPLDAKGVRFLVLGDIDLRWGVHQENISETLDRHGVSRWPVVWRGENYMILENPGEVQK